MAEQHEPIPQISQLVDPIVQSYSADKRTHHLDSTFLPNRNRTIEILELLRHLVFPGFFDQDRLTTDNITYRVGELLNRINQLLYEQVRQALRYEENRQNSGAGDQCGSCDEKARHITIDFLRRIPQIRRMLSLDVHAAFEGDPASVNTDEVIFCYPGLDAIFTHRIAHELWLLKVPMLPRIMSEHAHSATGIDIHPGAQIGESFFIDHATGVVIGETTIIGDRVKIYQGVTLGAMSTKGGQEWRGRKRHPTIEDDVTIYANATILGSDTVIGKGCTINGSVFLTQSVPPNHTVTMSPPQLKLRAQRQR